MASSVDFKASFSLTLSSSKSELADSVSEFDSMSLNVSSSITSDILRSFVTLAAEKNIIETF